LQMQWTSFNEQPLVGIARNMHCIYASFSAMVFDFRWPTYSACRDARFDARTLALRNIKRHKIICLSTSIVGERFLRERNRRNVINHWQCIYTFGEQRLTFAAIITLVHKWYSSSLGRHVKECLLVLPEPITAIR
jgi:hypothetical protein